MEVIEMEVELEFKNDKQEYIRRWKMEMEEMLKKKLIELKEKHDEYAEIIKNLNDEYVDVEVKYDIEEIATKFVQEIKKKFNLKFYGLFYINKLEDEKEIVKLLKSENLEEFVKNYEEYVKSMKEVADYEIDICKDFLHFDKVYVSEETENYVVLKCRNCYSEEKIEYDKKRGAWISSEGFYIVIEKDGFLFKWGKTFEEARVLAKYSVSLERFEFDKDLSFEYKLWLKSRFDYMIKVIKEHEWGNDFAEQCKENLE